MAAYSAVACFRHTLKQLLESDHFHLNFSKPQAESLYGKVSSLLSSLDKIRFVPKERRSVMYELQTSIREAIYAAQDEIDYSISKGGEKICLKMISDHIEEAVKMAESIREEADAQDLFLEDHLPLPPRSIQKDFEKPKPDKSRKDKIVGQEESFQTIRHLLLSPEEKGRQVIPITGMPGLGKTTLARSIYEDKQIKEHFNVRAWVTVSQEFNLREIFSSLLSSMENKNYRVGHYAMRGDELELFNRLYQELYNLKFLIVIDDVWDVRAWDGISSALPNKENGSRILLTTRLEDVGRHIRKDGFFHEMRPLGREYSWKLLCYKVFGKRKEDFPSDDEPPTFHRRHVKMDITEACPPHLRETGRRIADNCRGLPLSLAVVGGLLFEHSERYWQRIEQDTNDAKNSYSEILYLGYTHLPPKLKACFLYMGAFPEDCEIRVSKLIKLWVAEGFLAFLPGTEDSTLELVAQSILEDLVHRNLISVRELSSNGGIKVCSVHDSLRELAELESNREKFFHSKKKHDQEMEEGMENKRRVCVHRNLLMSLSHVYESARSIVHARSLLYLGSHHQHPLPFCLTFDLLRVMDAFTVYFIRFPDEFLQLVHLTYLSLTYNHDLPPKISRLQKLQTLMVRREPKLIFVGASFLPDEIWEMTELRHLWFTESDFPALPPSPPQIPLLLNLQTLTNVNAAFFADEVLDNMPNLKKLAMWIEAPDKLNFNVAKLHQLEHFKFVVLNPVHGKGIEVNAEHFFPRTLKRLNLSGSGFPWEYMQYVAENLPGLEVLKLKELAIHGGTWRPNYNLENLKYLLIEYLNFQTWEAGTSNYPSLEKLILRHCYELEEIPQDLGFSATLELLELVDCSPQAVESAIAIKEEQEAYGMDNFQIRIFSSWE